jgi:glutaconate CoA-transferase subunit A
MSSTQSSAPATRRSSDKTVSLEAIVSSLDDGAVLAFGGGGLDRKPMAVAKAIAGSTLRDLRLITFLGGPEVDLLIGLGKVAWIHFAYVGLDNLGMAPNFRHAREHEALEAVESSESLVMTGLEAAARRLPFLPTRSGLGADLLQLPNTPFQRFACPLTEEELVAVPPLIPDVAFIHANAADRAGNAGITGDLYADHLLARAATRTYVTAERIVDRLDRNDALISRLWVTGVCHEPGGTDFTSLYPERRLDRARAAGYAAQATDPAWLRSYADGSGAVA